MNFVILLKDQIFLSGKYFCSLLIFFCLLGLTVRAQTEAEAPIMDMELAPAADSVPIGPAPTSSEFNIENIDLYSGQLKTVIPLLNIGGRGDSAVNIAAVIQPEQFTGATTYPTNSGQVTFRSPFFNEIYEGTVLSQRKEYYNKLIRFGAGYGPGVVYAGWTSFTVPAASNGTCAAFTGSGRRPVTLTFADSSGKTYQLRDEEIYREWKYQVQRNSQQYYNGNCYQYRNINNAGKVYFSIDNHQIRFTADAVLNVPNSEQPPDNGFLVPDAWHAAADRPYLPTGYLDFGDGRRMRIEGGYVVWSRDRNGNYSTYDYQNVPYSGSGTPTFLKRVTKITDSLNREIDITYGDYFTPDVISFKGVGGTPRTIKIQRKRLESVLSPGNVPTNLKDLFRNWDNSSIHWQLNRLTAQYRYNPEIIASIEYADGKVSSFQYNSYGELAIVNKPTGTRVKYNYSSGLHNASLGGATWYDERIIYSANPLVYDDFSAWFFYRRLVETEVYEGEQLVNKTVISRPEAPNAPEPNRVVVNKYDDSNNLLYLQKHGFYNKFLRHHFIHRGTLMSNLPPWYSGLEETVENFNLVNSNLVLLKTEIKSWTHGSLQWNNYPVSLYMSERPRVALTQTILHDVNLKNQTSYQYDQYLNVIETKEYEYGSNLNVGPLKRQTNTEYLGVNPVTGIDYRQHGYGFLVVLPLQKKLYDGQDLVTPKSFVKYEYDNYAADTNHEPLLVRADISKNCIQLDAARQCVFPPPNIFRERGNLTSETVLIDAANESNGTIRTYKKYDVAGNVIKSKDALGNESRIEYDDAFADGQTRPFKNFAYPTQSITPAPDPSGQKGLTEGFTTSAVFDYDTGLVTSKKDTNNQETTTSYVRPDGIVDPLNRAQKISYPDGGWVSYEYGDAPGNIYVRTRTLRDFYPTQQVSDAYQYYDNFLRPTRSYSFSPNQTAAGWIASEIKYDALGRAREVSNPVRVQNPGGAITNAVWTTTSYDFSGRQIDITTSDGSKTITAYFGLKVMATDQAKKSRLTELDGLGRLVKVIEFNRQVPSPYVLEEPNSTDFLCTYEYDALDNLKKVTLTEPSQTYSQIRTFNYDSVKRLIFASNPESGNATYSYDNNNNLKTKIDARNVKTDFDYDNLNRLIQKRYSVIGTPPTGYSPTPTVDVFYDGKGMPGGINAPNLSKDRLTATKSSVSQTIYTGFDTLGRVISNLQIVDPNTQTPQIFAMEYTYNLAGEMKTMKYPSGKIVSTLHDSSGKITGTKKLNGDYYLGGGPNGANRVQYTPSGSVEALRLGNGKWEHTVYNDRLRPIETGLGNSPTDSSIFRLDYKYGKLVNGQNDLSQDNGNLERQVITVPGVAAFTQSYDYDQLNRLTFAKEVRNDGMEIWRQGFSYDRFGNRSIVQNPSNTTPDLAGTNFTINQNDNKITSSGFVYDAAGNLLEYPDPSGLLSFDYDGENKQTLSRLNQAQQATYFYDGDGKRIKKVSGSGSATQITVYVYSSTGQLLTEYSNQVNNTGRIGYVTPDHLGSTRIITNKDGSVRTRQDYLPFGEEVVSSLSVNGRQNISAYNSGDINQKFTGQERDQETGLDFFKSRYYSSSLGRFTSPDEFSGGAIDFFAAAASSKPTFYADPTNPQTFNKYQYGFNNPLRYVDPDGHESKDSYYSKFTDWFKGVSIPEYHPTPLNPEPVSEAQMIGYYSQILGQGIDTYLMVAEEAGADFGVRELSKQMIASHSGEGDNIALALAAGNTVVSILGTGIGVVENAVKNKAVSMADNTGEAAYKLAEPLTNCFVAGTLIHTEKGVVPIEEIKAGDKVLSYNEEIGGLEYQEVVRLFRNTADEFLKIRIEGESEPITVTLGHPFYVHRNRNSLPADAKDDGSWVLSKSLRAGDLLKLKIGEWKPIRSIEKVAGTEATYNFEVAKNHNYFVGLNGWLAHNDSIRIGDLMPLHSETTSGRRPYLEVLSDSELLDSVRKPYNNDPIKIYSDSGKIADGNGRAYELIKRAEDPNSSITFDTRVPFVFRDKTPLDPLGVRKR